MDPRFGRCAYFIMWDSNSEEWAAVDNPATTASGGAGPQAAQFLADQGVEAVVSGAFGPNAFTSLEAAGIDMYTAESRTVEELHNMLERGELVRVTSATVSAHHGGRGGRR
jgi:predicted Fe-Mo cluster-binding NifX family protein